MSRAPIRSARYSRCANFQGVCLKNFTDPHLTSVGADATCDHTEKLQSLTSSFPRSENWCNTSLAKFKFYLADYDVKIKRIPQTAHEAASTLTWRSLGSLTFSKSVSAGNNRNNGGVNRSGGSGGCIMQLKPLATNSLQQRQHSRRGDQAIAMTTGIVAIIAQTTMMAISYMDL